MIFVILQSLKRTACLMLAMIGLLAWMPSSARAAQDLIINVYEEYGGYYRAGDWYPIVVSIQNQPKNGKAGDRSLEFEGSLIIESRSNGPDEERPYEFVRDVQVPAFSTQRFRLMAKFSEPMSATPNLLIRANNGRLLDTIPINVQPLGRDKLLMVTVSNEARRLNIPLPRQQSVNSVTQAFLTPKHFPTHWSAYDPVDILVFPGWPEGQLQSAHIKALKDWVAMGGTLVFLGGSNSSSYGVEEASELVPVTTSSSNQYTVNESLGRLDKARPTSGTAAANGVLASDITSMDPDAEVIMEASGGIGNEVPILVRKAHGRGQILFLALDLDTPSRELNQIIAPYWLGVMPMNNVADWVYHVADNQKDMTVATGRAARPPNVVLIILICVIYTLIVGPVNFFLLSRNNRVQWAWFTVPVIVLVFSALIYTFGTLTKGGQSIGRQLSLLYGVQGDPTFEERSWISLFVPSPGNYFADPIDDTQTVSDSDRWNDRERLIPTLFMDLPSAATSAALGFGRSVPVIRSGDDKVFVDTWGLRTFDTCSFEMRGPRTLEGPIDAEMTYHSSIPGLKCWIEGTLTNNTGLKFYDSALFLGGVGKPLGPMEIGETVTFKDSDIEFQVKGNNPKWKRDVPNAFEKTSNPTNPETDFEVNQVNALRMVDAVMHPAATAKLLPPMKGKFLFIGLAENPELTATTNLERDLGTQSIVVIVELNPTIQKGEFFVPPALVQVNLQDFSRDGQFAIADERDGGELEIWDSEGLVSIEIPFRHPGIVPNGITSDVDAEVFGDNQSFLLGVYDNASVRFMPLITGRILPSENYQYLSPYSSRGWILMNSKRKDEQKGGGDSTRVKKIGFGVFGVQQ